MFRIFLAVLACRAAMAQPRVLIIGDSISLGYTPYVQRMLAGTARVEHNAASAFQTGNGVQRLKEWLGDGRWDVIHFDFGLQAFSRIQVSLDAAARSVRATMRWPAAGS